MYCLFQCVFPVQNRSHDVFVNFLWWKPAICAVLCNHISCFFVERNWKTGQPDNWNHGHGPGEDCAGLIYAGLWNDFYCEDVNNFICEKDMDKGKQGPWFNYFILPILNVTARGEMLAKCYSSALLRKRGNHMWTILLRSRCKCWIYCTWKKQPRSWL